MVNPCASAIYGISRVVQEIGEASLRSLARAGGLCGVARRAGARAIRLGVRVKRTQRQRPGGRGFSRQRLRMVTSWRFTTFMAERLPTQYFDDWLPLIVAHVAASWQGSAHLPLTRRI